MRIAAFSTASGADSVFNATGVVPRTFPPSSMGEFKREWLQGYDLLYFHLHGLRNESHLYGDGWQMAMSASQIRECDLFGTMAFIANCYGLGSKTERALLDAGCTAVVAGPGTNYAYRGGRVRGADLLGRYFISAFSRAQAVHSKTVDPIEALRLAKIGLELYLKSRNVIWRKFFSKPEWDALEFQATTR